METRTVEVSVEAGRSIRVECAVGTMTRLVFPERLLTLRWSKGAREALGARLSATAPVGIVEVRPTRLDTSGLVQARGPSQTVDVELTVVPNGVPLEVRLVMTGTRRLEELGVGSAASNPSTAVSVVPARALEGTNSPTARRDEAVERTNEPTADDSVASSGGAGQETP